MKYAVKITQTLESSIEGESLMSAMQKLVEIHRSRNLFDEMSDYVDTDYEVNPMKYDKENEHGNGNNVQQR